MKTFALVTALFQNIDKCVEFANRADAAYRASQNQPPEPFTAENQVAVASNIAGLYAADAAAQLLVARTYGAEGMTDPRFGEARYTAALEQIASGTLPDTSAFIVDLAANLAWRAGQPFKSLDRVTRPINMSFVDLSPEERAKDRTQVKEGAAFIREWLKQSEMAEAA